MFVWRDAMIVAILSAVALAYLGVWVVLKRVVFVPLALSQVSSFGLVLAVFLGGFLEKDAGHAHESGNSFDALLLSVAVSVVLGVWLARPREEGSQAVVSAYLIASAGVLLVGNLITDKLHDVESVLFGSAVLVETHQIFIVGGAALLVALTHFLYYRRFLFVSFDADAAGATGMPVFSTEALLIGSFALMISVVTQAIGALPAFGLMVLPGMFALRLANSMRTAFVLAILLGMFSAGVGYYISFQFDTPTGATMVALAALGYLGSLGISRGR
jgi:zinc transport system permease protein